MQPSAAGRRRIASVSRRSVRPAVVAPALSRTAQESYDQIRQISQRSSTQPGKWAVPAAVGHLALIAALIVIGDKVLAPAGEQGGMVTVAFVDAGQTPGDASDQTQSP